VCASQVDLKLDGHHRFHKVFAMSKIMRQLYEEARLAREAAERLAMQSTNGVAEPVTPNPSPAELMAHSRKFYEDWVESLRKHFANQRTSPSS
jgi:hypothetical protein